MEGGRTDLVPNHRPSHHPAPPVGRCPAELGSDRHGQARQVSNVSTTLAVFRFPSQYVGVLFSSSSAEGASNCQSDFEQFSVSVRQSILATSPLTSTSPIPTVPRHARLAAKWCRPAGARSCPGTESRSASGEDPLQRPDLPWFTFTSPPASEPAIPASGARVSMTRGASDGSPEPPASEPLRSAEGK